jgi:uncharacterized membrane protein YesL
MQFQQSRIFQGIETAVNYLLLNLLWLLMCLPIITIYPATAALFGVTRSWSREEEPGIVGPFFRHFRENFALSLLVGIVWTLLGALLLLNVLLSSRVADFVALPLVVVTGIAGLTYALVSPYIFPVIVSFHATPLGVFKNAALLAIAQPFLSLLAAITLLSVAIISWFAPFTLFCSGVAVASGLTLLARRGMRRFLTDGADPASPGGVGAG